MNLDSCYMLYLRISLFLNKVESRRETERPIVCVARTTRKDECFVEL